MMETNWECKKSKHMITVKIHNSSICLVRNTSIEVGDKLKNLSETAEKNLWRYGSNESCQLWKTECQSRQRNEGEQWVNGAEDIIKCKTSANSFEKMGRGMKWPVLKFPRWIKRTHWVPGKLI